jgi:hypothetical protein
MYAVIKPLGVLIVPKELSERSSVQSNDMFHEGFMEPLFLEPRRRFNGGPRITDRESNWE